MTPHERDQRAPHDSTSRPGNLPDGAESSGDGDRLSYLLTAYLFDNLSPAGREEVEEQLERDPEIAREFEGYQQTLGWLEDALGASPEGGGESSQRAAVYSFDERRRERVLAAARRRRGGIARFVYEHPGLTWAAVVAIVAVPLLGTLPFFLVDTGSRSSSGTTDFYSSPRLPRSRSR